MISSRPVTGLGACSALRQRAALPSTACKPRCVRVQAAAAGKVKSKAEEEDIKTRGYRRVVYDFESWKRHRTADRYVRHLIQLPGSRIIWSLSQPLGVVIAISTFIGSYHTLLEAGIIPEYCPKFTFAGAEPQALTSFALSLLLVFRTNTSYARFDEARKIWGGILNRARHISNQAVTFIPVDDVKGREAVVKWTVGFCQALRAHLQEDADLRAELAKCEPKWTKDEIEILATAQHRPIKAISMLSELTRQLDINQFQAMQMQENVQFFYDALGGCERLLRTPIPVSYTRHTSRFLILWMSILPLGLWDKYHWSMLPIIAFVGFLLLGIDEIGVQVEEPFGILPLDVISKRAETDGNSLLKDDSKVSSYIFDYRTGLLMDPSTSSPVYDEASDLAAAATTAAAAAAVAASSNGNGNGAPSSNGNGLFNGLSPFPRSSPSAVKQQAAAATDAPPAPSGGFSFSGLLGGLSNLAGGNKAPNKAPAWPSASKSAAPSSSSSSAASLWPTTPAVSESSGSASAADSSSSSEPRPVSPRTLPANWKQELENLRSSSPSGSATGSHDESIDAPAVSVSAEVMSEAEARFGGVSRSRSSSPSPLRVTSSGSSASKTRGDWRDAL